MSDRPVSDVLRAGAELARILEILAIAREDAKSSAKEWRGVIEAHDKRARDLARAIRTGEFQPGLFDGEV